MHPAQVLSTQSFYDNNSLLMDSNGSILRLQDAPVLNLMTPENSRTSGQQVTGKHTPCVPTLQQSSTQLSVKQDLACKSVQVTRTTGALPVPESGSRDSQIQNPFPNRKYEKGVEGVQPRSSISKTCLEAENYCFPRNRLKTRLSDERKVPLVLVACGSFSPPTYLHLRVFEMAKDAIVEKGEYEIIGGYYSPVSDKYRKPGLALAEDRIRMCELAVHQTSDWLMVDPWEALQTEYTRTAFVLEHFDSELNGGKLGGIPMRDGSRKKIQIMLVAGGDLIHSMGTPGVWPLHGLRIVLGKFGCVVVERTGSDIRELLLSDGILNQYRKNIIVVKQLIYNDISSSKVRLFVERGMSIRFLLPDPVIQYINDNHLYRGVEAAGHPPSELK